MDSAAPVEIPVAPEATSWRCGEEHSDLPKNKSLPRFAGRSVRLGFADTLSKIAGEGCQPQDQPLWPFAFPTRSAATISRQHTCATAREIPARKDRTASRCLPRTEPQLATLFKQAENALPKQDKVAGNPNSTEAESFFLARRKKALKKGCLALAAHPCRTFSRLWRMAS